MTRQHYLQFVAIVLTALALVPGGAHFFELPNKIGLSRDDYFVVQSIYNGWALFGFIIIPALAANAAVAVTLRRQRAAAALALLATLLIALTLVLFFIFVYPANVATANWTQAPENWEALRLRWEYVHALDALITFVAFCAAVLSALLANPAR